MRGILSHYKRKSASQTRVCRVAQPLANQVVRRNRQENGQARKSGQPPCARQEDSSIRQDRSPACSRGRNSHTQEAESGLDQDRRGHSEGGGDENRRQRVRQKMPEDRPKVAGSKGLSRDDIIKRLGLQKLAADETRDRRPVGYTD